MTTPAYAEIGVTTNFSFLRGASHPQEYVHRAGEYGLHAIGIADRNTLAGVVRAYAELKNPELTTYSLFATSPEAQLQHGERLLYTVPVVIFGMLRYTYQVHQGRGEDVARDLLRDPWILAAGVGWLAIFLSRWL